MWMTKASICASLLQSLQYGLSWFSSMPEAMSDTIANCLRLCESAFGDLDNLLQKWEGSKVKALTLGEQAVEKALNDCVDAVRLLRDIIDQ